MNIAYSTELICFLILSAVIVSGSLAVVLLENILNLGNIGDKVTVKNGYGRNYLIPQGLAILATPSSKKVLAENIKQREFKEKRSIFLDMF